MRKTEAGATRDEVNGKPQYEGYLSPIVIKRFGEYMLKHQTQADGELRDADNWQKGLKKEWYIDSAWRHFMDWWLEHRGYESREGLQDALCALLFNVSGYLYEDLRNDKS